MSKSRYVVEYLAEGGSDVESMFIEAKNKTEAEQAVTDRFGAFITILSVQLTKSCGGSGKTQTSTEEASSVEPEDQAIAAEAPVKKEKKVKAPAAPKAEKKVTKASQVREKIIELKAVDGTPEQAIAWSMETLAMPKGAASAYVKAIWNE